MRYGGRKWNETEEIIDLATISGRAWTGCDRTLNQRVQGSSPWGLTTLDLGSGC
jgi:hypothetical protein